MDYELIFEASPVSMMLLDADFYIRNATNAYLHDTLTKREDVVDHHLFEVFPNNPDDPGADGVQNLTASLNRVVRTLKPDRMAIQRYDIRRPDGTFETRFWSPMNSPILDELGKLTYILHRAEDVTRVMKISTQITQVSGALENVSSLLSDLFKPTI